MGYTYEPLTIESFANNLRNNPPLGENMSLWDDDSIVEWAESNPDYATYFKSHVNNPKPIHVDSEGNQSVEPWHDTSIPVGQVMSNPTYIQDYEEYKASKDPEHLKYLGFNVEQMATDLGSGIAGGLGWMEDPDGMAKFRTNALEMLADKSKWVPMQNFYLKGLAKLSQGMELEG